MLHLDNSYLCKYNNIEYTGKTLADLLDRVRPAVSQVASQKTQLFGFSNSTWPSFGASNAATPAGTGNNEAEAKREKAEKLLKAIDRQLRVGKAAASRRSWSSCWGSRASR